MRISYERLGEIARAPRNPKWHDEEGLDASYARFGYVAPMIVDEGTGELVAGHGRLDGLIARKDAGEPPPARIRTADDGEWLVPVVRGVKFDSRAEAEAYLLADNRLTENGGYDDEALAAVLRDHRDRLDGIGYQPDEVAGIMERAGLVDVQPPGEFPEPGEGVQQVCPSCGHQW